MQTTTEKGQIVIPVHLRRKYGIRRGTQVEVLEQEGQIILRPHTPEQVRAQVGLLRGSLKGVPLLEDLMARRAQDRKREDEARRTRSR